MKIETSIKPRKDGTVIVAIDNQKYVFKADEAGVMTAEVESEAHIAILLARGDDFLPADDADFERADALVSGAKKDSETDEDDDGPEDEDLDDDGPETLNAAPIEEPASVVAAGVPARGATKIGKKK